MINLKQISFNYLKFSLFLIIFSFNSQILLSSENKIIFKINNKAFTTLDYQKRKQYLQFVGNNSSLSKGFIVNDFISANLFFEHYRELNLKLNLDEIQVFENIKEANKQNNREFDFELNKTEILANIKIDLVRKAILENILNSNLRNLNVPLKDIDLLYKFKVNYINFDSLDNDKIINELTTIKGVGSWTAEMFLIFILFRENIFSKKDIALLNSIKLNYNIETLDDKKLNNLIKSWAPYNTYASLILWKSIEEKIFFKKN